MERTTPLQRDNVDKGEADSALAKVNELARGAVDLEKSDALSPEADHIADRVDLSRASLATSLPTAEDAGLRPVKFSELSYYLNLACHHKSDRVRESEEVFTQKLVSGLPAVSKDSTQMVEPNVIKGLLEMLELNPEDWEKATVNSDLCGHLGAASAQKAAKLNLPPNASPQQIKSEETLQRELSGVIRDVSKKIASIRENLEGSVGLLQSDGSIQLDTLDVSLGDYYHNLLRNRLSEAYEKISTVKSSSEGKTAAVVGPLCVGVPLVANYILTAGSDRFMTIFSGASLVFVGLLAGIGCYRILSEYYREREKSAKKEAYTQIVDGFLAANCSSPALEALQKSLGEMGVQMSLSGKSSKESTNVKLHFTISAPQKGAT